MRNCLVVCYSRTGWTAGVGREIAALCGGDFEQIREARGRAGTFGFLRSALEGRFGRAAPILPAEKNPADYTHIILGTPVWAGRMAAPMRSYLLHYRKQFHRVSLFCTMGGRGGEQTLAEMAALCGREEAVKLVLRDEAIRQGRHRSSLPALLRQPGGVQ